MIDEITKWCGEGTVRKWTVYSYSVTYVLSQKFLASLKSSIKENISSLVNPLELTSSGKTSDSSMDGRYIYLWNIYVAFQRNSSLSGIHKKINVVVLSDSSMLPTSTQEIRVFLNVLNFINSEQNPCIYMKLIHAHIPQLHEFCIFWIYLFFEYMYSIYLYFRYIQNCKINAIVMCVHVLASL